MRPMHRVDFLLAFFAAVGLAGCPRRQSAMGIDWDCS